VADRRRGILLGLSAYVLWGLFPLYWPLLKPAGALEILAHRITWSFALIVLVVVVRRRWAWVGALLADRRRLLLIMVASVAIALNWGVYIWGVNAGYVVETSLGYFINPLVTVCLGVVLLGERLRRMQWVAVGLAVLAVVVMTVGTGRPPWIGLVLAFSFATYGLVKKQIGMPAVESLAGETTFLLLPALALLVGLQLHGTGTFGHAPWHVSVLLGLCGLVTAVPLLLFGAAAPLLPLTTIGLLQYVTPIMQFLLGVLVFGETMPPARWAGFVLVWAALVVFSADQLRNGLAVREAAREGAALV